MHNIMPRLRLDESGNSSVKSYEVRRVAEKARALPEVRSDMISSLRARIEAGIYFVSGEMIAEMVVRRLFADLVA